MASRIIVKVHGGNVRCTPCRETIFPGRNLGEDVRGGEPRREAPVFPVDNCSYQIGYLWIDRTTLADTCHKGCIPAKRHRT